jgi:hypothetical protein
MGFLFEMSWVGMGMKKEDEDEDRRCKKEASRLKMSWVVGIGVAFLNDVHVCCRYSA